MNRQGGGGGKGTWGKPGSEINPTPAYIDARDPNYPEEDEGDGTVFNTFEPELSLEEVKKQVAEIALEFFENGDTEEVKEEEKKKREIGLSLSHHPCPPLVICRPVMPSTSLRSAPTGGRSWWCWST